MKAVFKGNNEIGAILKVMVGARPWYAYDTDGKGENFKTRKEAVGWLADQQEDQNARR